MERRTSAVRAKVSTSPAAATIRVLEVICEPIMHGGEESFVLSMLNGMDRAGMVFDVLTPYWCDSDAYRDCVPTWGGSIFELGLPFAPGSLRLNLIAAFHSFFRSRQYDLVHVHSCSVTALALACREAHSNGATVIAHAHRGLMRLGRKKRAIRTVGGMLMGDSADALLACSDTAAHTMFDERRMTRKPLVIKNGIDTGKYGYDPLVRASMRKRLGIGRDACVLGHVGRMSAEKNQLFACDVFHEVVLRRPNSRLLFVGDGDMRALIEDRLRTLGIEDRAILVGAVDNVHDYLQAMDVFLFPSTFEGLGIACVEAQSTGLVVLASDQVPRESKVSDTIHYLDLGSAEQWASRALELSSYGRVSATEGVRDAGYDVSTSASRLGQVYRDLASRSGRT